MTKLSTNCNIGRCSVPMWSGGCPAGSCENHAFGLRPAGRVNRTVSGYEYRDDMLYAGYVPGLACPVHGGPKLVTAIDGNMWFAALPGFTNLQECETGWGVTEQIAVADLMQVLTNAAP